MAAIAQTRRAARNRANLPSGLDSPAPRSGADLITLERLSRQQLFDPLGCGGLVDALDRGKLAHQPVESRLIDLPFAVGLFRLARVAVEIANHFGYGTRVSGSDLRLVFLGTPAPHSPLGTRSPAQFRKRGVHFLLAGQPSQAGHLGFAEGHAQGHPVLVEMHHKHAERVTGYLLRLNRDYFADPVGRIHDEITGGKGGFLRIHIRLSQSTHLALPGRFSWSLDWATVTPATRRGVRYARSTGNSTTITIP